MAEELQFPRLIYRGEPDTLGAGNVGETMKVTDQSALDAALKDGWRLTRDEPKANESYPSGWGETPQTVPAGTFNPHEESAADVKAYVATVTTHAELARLRTAETAHPTHVGGRSSVLKAIADRDVELA